MAASMKQSFKDNGVPKPELGNEDRPKRELGNEGI
jgi:hypothetical protein